MSTVSRARTVAVLYSSLGAHARFREDELPGGWFVEALAPLGHGAAAVRQALFRMEKKGELVSRREGRRKWYQLSAFGQAAVDATYRKMTEAAPSAWDGQWSIVTFAFGVGDRATRDRFRWILELEGFAPLRRGVYLHPHPRLQRVQEAAEGLGCAAQVFTFRGERLPGESDAELVGRLWDIAGLQGRYREFVRAFTPVLRRRRAGKTPSEAFALRLALAIRYSAIAWDDPELPPELLPGRWPGARAREVTMQLYERLLPGALTHGDAILARVLT